MKKYNSVTDVEVIELRNGCGHMPVTLKTICVSDAVMVAEALVGKQKPSQWLLWCMASLFSHTDAVCFVLFFSVSMKSHYILVYFLLRLEASI